MSSSKNGSKSIRSSSGSIRSLRSTDDNHLLKTITEASHESRSMHDEEQNNQWWFWKSNDVRITEIRPSISREAEELEVESWYNWFGNYKNSVAYVFYRNGEGTPLLSDGREDYNHGSNGQPNHNSQQKGQPQKNDGWLTWLWNSPSEEEEDYEGFTNDVELYKLAKNAIETSKDSCCYAYKGSINSQFLINDHELSVYDTPTQSQPVKYNIKRTPVTPAESQENSIQVIVSNLSPAKTPVMSSNSSIKSIEAPPPPLMMNRIIPNIEENFRTITFITRLRLIGEKLLFQQKSSENHLYKQSLKHIENKKLHKIKRIMIIGVHGFLPTKFVKSMIGQQTGNSLTFVEEASKAVKYWLNDTTEPGFENMYHIDTISLEGQGTIEQRVEKSLALLNNWMMLIKDCDFLYFVAHGQGSIISIKLLARLLQSSEFKINNKRIGLLSMAGPLLGPMKNLDTKIVIRAYTTMENEVLQELIELGKSNSETFQNFRKDFECILNHDVKVTLSGSINDQLIPLESSLGNNFYHPNIFRTIFVDSNSNTPSFLINLWKLILMCRNIGHLEHGILKDLSERCMGMINDGGHGKIFKDSDIYLTSLKFALESTKVNQKRDMSFITHHNDRSNDLFKLPWSVRELLEDTLQSKHITNMKLIKDLIESFNEWDPSKAWKDYKFALDALSEIDYDDLLV
ncbi:uncharacterized protein CLIB1444_01S12926 [[Candida] jaroonii]|uniref:Uncharacterized protein n=1 Tax=[Candida] jaroonii TaxID=467808 RepID=A0ACA9Y1B0_9ASCO|nr:uncharacterized protein CLIB1444_01S12926 [[Candida] jaroonii]